ncbi:MAG: MBOAT family O-acyltransferase [Suilimivivens sp.]
MLFNSYAFVFLFFPLCILGFYICKAVCNRTEKDWLIKVFLFAVSLWFYGFLNPLNLPVILISMVINYMIYFLMEKGKQKKLLLVTGLLVNLAALFFFKYTGSSFVPLGISFFTFSQIAFLMECYRDNLEKVSALDYGVYVSFFPKLAEGPIALPGEMLTQMRDICKKKFSWEQFYRGMCLFVLGLSKKVLLADTFGGAVDYGYSNLAALHSADALIVMLSYTLQIYFDFSGYCDMAMGIGSMLLFDLPLNFDSPYKAGNIMEFWKGWHITLTRFFTRYLYIPLGGNRKGRGRTYFNTLIVFLVSGIWHGAGLQFIVWGMMHGILYVITRWWVDRKGERRTKKTRLFSVVATFLYVNVAWVFFRAPSVKEALTLLKTMVSFNMARINRDLAGYFNLDEFWYVIKVFHIDSWQYAYYILMAVLLIVALIIVFFGKTAVTITGMMKPTVLNTFIMAVLFVWCVITFSEVSSFIYFNF